MWTLAVLGGHQHQALPLAPLQVCWLKDYELCDSAMLPSLLPAFKNATNIFWQTTSSIVIYIFNKFQPHCMHWPRPSRRPWRTRTWTRSTGRVNIENNLTFQPVVWMKSFVAFLKAESKQNNMAMSLTSRQNWFSFFWVTKVKSLTSPLQKFWQKKRCHDVSPPPQCSARGQNYPPPGEYELLI